MDSLKAPHLIVSVYYFKPKVMEYSQYNENHIHVQVLSDCTVHTDQTISLSV